MTPLFGLLAAVTFALPDIPPEYYWAIASFVAGVALKYVHGKPVLTMILRWIASSSPIPPAPAPKPDDVKPAPAIDDLEKHPVIRRILDRLNAAQPPPAS